MPTMGSNLRINKYNGKITVKIGKLEQAIVLKQTTHKDVGELVVFSISKQKRK